MKNRLASSAAAGLVVALSAVASAQSSNYHALSNGRDITIGGVGSGGNQTASDGIGVYIPGEDLRGATRGPSGDFAYKTAAFTESACILKHPAGGQPLTLHYPLIAWFEFTGGNGHAPVVFPNPADTNCATFPLGGSAGFVPFGTPAGSSASFVVASVPFGSGSDVLIPNENLSPSGAGMASLLIGVEPGAISITSTGFCWTTQFQWVPSAISSLNDANNGWWMWTANNPLGNQYWGMSGDELNLWKSHTVASDNGLTAVTPFTADAEYSRVMTATQPSTNLATWPTAFFGESPYGTNTSNVLGADGLPAANPHGGYDLGGHGTLSLTGRSGVPSIHTGLSTQDRDAVNGIAPSGLPLQRPTIGFHTYDSLSNNGSGSKRVVWLSIDFDHMLGCPPDQSGEVLVANGAVRVPLPISACGGTFPQPLTIDTLPIFGHEAFPCPSCPSNPGDLFSFEPVSQGASAQVTLPNVAICTGMPLPITYGSSALANQPGIGRPAGGLLWNQALGATSGSKTFFLFE